MTTATTLALGATQIARALGHDLPTEEQIAVIEAPLEPLLVVAGAGSGKTETMSARVVYLVANGLVRPEEVLGLTFTRKAAAELAHRVRTRLGELRAAGLTDVPDITDATDDDHPRRGAPPADAVQDQPLISTYNSFAAALARDHALRVGADPDARLITDAAAWQMADEVVEGWDADLATDRSPGSVIQAVLGLAGELNEHLLDVDEARDLLTDLRSDLADRQPAARAPRPREKTAKAVATLDERIALLDVVAAYRRRKREHGLLDFGDQVALAAEIARRVPEVGAELRERYRVVLLDEFQDTSVAQLSLLAGLFGAGHAVTAVGDPHQAIYGWRGASAGALASFAERFAAIDTPTRTLALSTSWRNDRAILDVANVVSRRLRERPGPGPRVEVPRLGPRPGAGAGEVLGFYAADAAGEGRQVAELLAQRWSPGEGRSAAVLCRKRSQFPDVVAALRERGLPHRVLGLGGLLATPEVADLRCLLEAAHDPGRGDSLMRLLTERRLGAMDLHALNDWAQQLARDAVAEAAEDDGPTLDARAEASLAEALEDPPRPGWTSGRGHTMSKAGARRVRRVGEQLRRVRRWSHLPLPELVTAAEQLLGLDIEVAARPGAGPSARASLDAVTEVAAGFAAEADRPGLGAFLAWLDAAEEHERGLDAGVGEDEPATDVVQVLTVHAAKGLEWDVVAVPGLVESQFPGYECAPRPTGQVTDSAWLTAIGELPYPLRGDAESLPALQVAGAATYRDVEDAVLELRDLAGEHRVAEERRLAYVAVTRARSSLILSGSWFRTGKTPLPPSRFLLEPREAGLLGAGPEGQDEFAPPPADGAENPALTDRRGELWPTDPLVDHRPAREAAAAAVLDAAPAALAAATGGEERGSARTTPDPVADGWTREAELLLAERAAAATPEPSALDGHLSASAAVGLVTDPVAFARQRRRPVPVEPTLVARRGTRFHAWVESFYERAALLDVDDVGGAGGLDDAALAALQQTFRSSPWASRTPVAMEVDLETPVAGVLVRCRIDAVFEEPGAVDVVDWKTGGPPRTAEELADREMQLALYRLAWSRATGVPLERVRAAFYYVGADTTVHAGDLTEQEIVARIAQSLRATR